MPDSIVTDLVHEKQSFEDHARAVLGRIRTALAEVFSALGVNPAKPQEVARRFNLNKNLTWKVSKIICERDPAVAFRHVPGRAGITILLETLKKSGAPVNALGDLNKSFHDLDHLIDLHAGDRETFEMMLGSIARTNDAQQHAEAQRKLSFRGNSAIWGVQARVQLCVNFIAPSDDPAFVDLAWLSGLVDFRRLRGDATWAIASARKAADDGTILPVGNIEAIDPDFDGPDRAPLLGKFCSEPTPKIRAELGRDGFVRYELVEGRIGNTAAETCIIGIFGRRFLRRIAREGDTIGEHVARLYTPVEMLIHDLFVHKDLSYAFSPDVALYSQLPSHAPFPTGGREKGLLPLWERVHDLGRGSSAVLTPELPQHHEMIKSVFDRLKWSPDDFHVFRFEMRYPPIPTLAVLRYTLPQS